jgi:uncharacterized protein involved in type VI secretion and phage assembly
MSILDAFQNEGQPVSPVRGLAAGIVTNNKDPKKWGRVKIRFPWLSDKNESDWARVASLMTGKQMGSFFLPEVNDEVLVGFEHGDINKPYVIGSLWNGKAPPPETNKDGKNNIRTFKSRSGHEIRFDDTKQKEKVEIKTKSGHSILLDDASSKGKIEIKSKAGHKFLMDDASGKGKVEFQSKAGHKIVLDDASGKEQVEIKDKSGSNKIIIDSAKKAINIESSQKLKIKSNEITLEGTKVTIKASAQLTLKGAMVKIN